MQHFKHEHLIVDGLVDSLQSCRCWGQNREISATCLSINFQLFKPNFHISEQNCKCDLNIKLLGGKGVKHQRNPY